MLEGRAHELEKVGELLEAARRGRGRALLLHGEAGIGKTSLLAAAAVRGADLTVLRTSGHEAETGLPFTALRRLVEPLLALRERLPPVQAQALGTALALEPPSPQERLAVPVALLALLRLAAAERPLLALVDDVQWLDPASRETILFAARRLGSAGGAAMLLALRDGDGVPRDAAGLDRLAVGPLDADSARALLRRAPQPLADAAQRAVAAAAGGNPLALVELSTALTPAQRAGRAPLDAPPRPGPLLEASFARRLAGLAPDERSAVTLAAAMEHGPLAWLLAALEESGVPAAALDAAERARIVVVTDGEVALRHPLLRAAVYHAATAPERQAAHRALAATAPDPRRRAWQLAGAADKADPGVAAALEAAARDARAIGGHAEAASAFARAAELSGAESARGRCELEAAHELATTGALDRALAFLDAAEPRDGADLLAIARLRGNLEIRRGDPHGAYRKLVAEGERNLAAGDGAAAVTLFLEASVAPMLTGDLDQQQHVVDRALAAARPVGGEPLVLAELVAAELLAVRGLDAEGEAGLAAVAGRIGEVDLLAAELIVGMAAQASMWLGAFDRAEEIVGRMLDACRAARALGRMHYPLSVRSQIAWRRGDWEAAARDAEEAVQLARATGQDTLLAFVLAIHARLLAGRGETATARALLAEALEITDRERADGIAVHAHASLALAELADGRPLAAAAAARRADEVEAPLGLRQPTACLAAADELDGLLQAGRTDAARAAVDALAARARAGGSAWAAAVVARAEVSLAADADVAARAEAAVAACAGLGMPFEQARTDLAIGERLRRGPRRADARAPLARALETFERLGSAPFAERSRVGLEPASTRAAEAQPPRLAGVELRLATLVAQGRTNREIAAQLQLGEKTLERRLTALYRRLGIASRTELARFAGDEAGWRA